LLIGEAQCPTFSWMGKRSRSVIHPITGSNMPV